jgi:hypothetical protein
MVCLPLQRAPYFLPQRTTYTEILAMNNVFQGNFDKTRHFYEKLTFLVGNHWRHDPFVTPA